MAQTQSLQAILVRAVFNNWTIFYLIVFLSWSGLVVMGLGNQINDTSLFSRIIAACTSSILSLNGLTIFLMWILMSFGMMAPTIIPTLKTYDDILQGGGKKENSFWFFILGFLFVWFFFSLIASTLQLLFAEFNLLQISGGLNNSLLSSIFLLGAGFYQLSSLKQACLAKCQSPFTFFLKNWKSGLRGSFLMGIIMGIFCLGCCWALMCLAFVGGTMNLVFMFIMTIFMVLEKMPQFGKFITKPLSLALIACATVLVWI